MHFTRYHKAITVPNILLSALLGSMGMTTLASATGSTSDEEGANTAAQVHVWYTSIMSMIIALLTALDNALSYGVKASTHAMVARTYTKMSTNIEVQLVRSPGAREDPNMFIDKLINTMEQLRESSPEIPGFILRRQPLLISPDNGARPAEHVRPSTEPPRFTPGTSIHGYAGAPSAAGRRYLQRQWVPPSRGASWRGGWRQPTQASGAPEAERDMPAMMEMTRTVKRTLSPRILHSGLKTQIMSGVISDAESSDSSSDTHRVAQTDEARLTPPIEEGPAVVNFLCQHPKRSVILER